MKKRQPTASSLETLIMAVRAEGTHPRLGRTRSILMSLAVICAFMMIGFGIATPLFVKRLSELGAGVEALSVMTMASALAQFLLAPWMGKWADRFGRRPFVLFAMAGLTITHFAFLSARTVTLFIILRFLQGAVSVGLGPAVMGIIADLIVVEQRTRWVGVIMSGYAAGIVFGPLLGGLLLEYRGFVPAFGLSALFTLLALLLALLVVPETRHVYARKQTPYKGRPPAFSAWRKHSVSLPLSFSSIAPLLLLDFISVLSMEFLGPQMVFYLYETLALPPIQYGFVMGSYGLALLVGQAGLGGLGERFSRKYLIALGFLLTSALPLSLLLFHRLAFLMLGALFAGVGSALIMPALGSLYLDRAPEQHHSHIMGVRESIVSLGAVVGPLLLACSSHWLSPQRVFTATILIALATAILTLALLNRSKVGSTVRIVPERATLNAIWPSEGGTDDTSIDDALSAQYHLE